MGYYLQKVRRIELLSMSAEFLKDEQDNVWFSHASKIQYRPIQRQESEAAQALKRAIAANKKHQMVQDDHLKRQVEEFERSKAQMEDERETFASKKVQEFMDKFYTDMKDEMGIDVGNEQEEEDPKMKEVLRIIRPNLNAKNSREFFAPKHNIHKN